MGHWGSAAASPGEADPGPCSVHSGQSHTVFSLASPCQTLLTQPLRVRLRPLWAVGWDGMAGGGDCCLRLLCCPWTLLAPDGRVDGQVKGRKAECGALFLPVPHQHPSAWPAWGCSVSPPSSSLDQVEANTCVDGLTCCPCPDQTGINWLLPLAKA